MEAVSHNANRHLSFDRPSRAAAPEGFLFSHPPAPRAPIAVRHLPERGTRTPACVMQAKRGACRRERRGRKLAVHRWRGEPKSSLRRRAIVQSAATYWIFAAICGAEFQVVMRTGYFAVNEPPLMGGSASTVPLDSFPIAACSKAGLPAEAAKQRRLFVDRCERLGRLAGRCCEAASIVWCARHGVDVGGGSPLQALMTGTDSGRQLRRREAGWGGSWKQSSELTNRNRIRGRCGGVTRPWTGKPNSHSDTRIGKSGGDRAKDQRLTLGDLFVSPAIGVGRRQRRPMDGEKSAEAIIVRATG